MSKTFKIVLILLVVASLSSAVLAVFAFMGKEREYMKRVLLEDKLAAILKDKRRLEKDIDSSKEAAKEAEKKTLILEAEIKRLSSQIEEEKEKSKAGMADLDTLKKNVVSLEEELNKEKKEKLSISKELQTMELDYETAKKEIAKLEAEKRKLKKDLSDLKESSVDLDKIVVTPSRETVSAPEPVEEPKRLLRGRVLVVNKEYSFIVTDLGKDDGVEKGIIFEIRDGTDFIGKAEVDKVYDTMSSATLMPGSSINSVKKGNLVIESI